MAAYIIVALIFAALIAGGIALGRRKPKTNKPLDHLPPGTDRGDKDDKFGRR